MDVVVAPDVPDEQVDLTIDLMRRYVVEDAGSPEIRRDAQLLADVYQPGNEDETIQAVHSFVQDRVHFRTDTETSDMSPESAAPDAWTPVAEILIRPRDMAVMCETGGCLKAGDCDDYAMYAAALLRALGIRSSFVTLAADPNQPDEYSHVYLAAYTSDGRRVPLDASHGEYAGWEKENLLGKRKEWPVEGRLVHVLLFVALGLACWWALKHEGAVRRLLWQS
jgi:predicted transglutaminase-like cysteine proteinase